MIRRYLGIDPGLSGGLAVLDVDDEVDASVELLRTPVVVVRKRNMLRREYDVPGMCQELTWRCAGRSHVAIVLEHVGPRPAPRSAGGQGHGVIGAFRLGVGFGLWHAAAVATAKPLHFVAPAIWKRHAGLLGCDKAASRLRAAELYPSVGRLIAADEGCAEALLMAHWLAARTTGTVRDAAAAHA